MANVLLSAMSWLHKISGFLNPKATSGGPCGPKRCVELTRLCLKRAQEMMLSRRAQKLNFIQCKYLATKLDAAIDSADSFLELLNNDYSSIIPSPEEGKESNYLESFKLLYGLALLVENFISRCCFDKWIQSALNLANVMQHVLSLGFDLQLWTLFYSDIKRTWTQEEVDGFFKAEAEIVQQKASLDRGILLKDLNFVLQAQGSTKTDRQLAAYMKDLLERFEEARPRAASYAPELPDSTLFETVKLREKIGRGGFASVFKVKWRGSELAMKEFAQSSEPFFKKEVSVLIGLSHPNIVSLMGYRADKRGYSIFMELLDKSLLSLIHERLRDGSLGRDTPFDILEAVDIMLQIGEGMRYVHEMRIVHRDLKSENILVRCFRDPDLGIELVAAAKVADFGLSKIKERSVTPSNQTPNVGTTRWMAPEVLKSLSDSEELKYPFKSDIYSFALVCYETLTGRLPFSTISDVREVKNMVLKGIRPDLPEGCPLLLKNLIERCWSQDASKRPRFCEICVELRNLKCSLIMPSIQTMKVSQAWNKPAQPPTKPANAEETESGSMSHKSIVGEKQGDQNSIMAASMNGVKQGPWGRSERKKKTGLFDQVADSIKSIKLKYDQTPPGIGLMEVEYVKSDANQTFKERYSDNVIGANLAKIDLEATEYVSQLSGIVGKYIVPVGQTKVGLPCVVSLTIHTNLRSYGPFGDEVGQRFSSGTGRVIGFFGAAGVLLDKIGVWIIPDGQDDGDKSFVIED